MCFSPAARLSSNLVTTVCNKVMMALQTNSPSGKVVMHLPLWESRKFCHVVFMWACDCCASALNTATRFTGLRDLRM